MKLPSLHEEWVLYQIVMLPVDTSLELRTRLLVAFYGGMHVVLQHMASIMECDDINEAHAAYDAMFKEMSEFHELMRSTREQREKDDV